MHDLRISPLCRSGVHEDCSEPTLCECACHAELRRLIGGWVHLGERRTGRYHRVAQVDRGAVLVTACGRRSTSFASYSAAPEGGQECRVCSPPAYTPRPAPNLGFFAPVILLAISFIVGGVLSGVLGTLSGIFGEPNGPAECAAQGGLWMRDFDYIILTEGQPPNRWDSNFAYFCFPPV